MNIMLIVVIMILALFALVGWHKGLIKIVMSLAAMLVTIIACVFLTPMISNFVRNHTQVYDKLNQSIFELIIDNDSFKQVIDDNITQEDSLNVNDIDLTKINEYGDTVSKYMELVVDKMQFPDSIAQKAGEIMIPDSILQIADMNSISDILAAIISARLTSLALNAIVYVIVFVIVFITVRILFIVTKVIEKIPVLKDVNKLMGLLLGIAEGLIVVWLLFALVTACSRFDWAASALADIGGNGLLSFIYDHNLIMSTLFKV